MGTASRILSVLFRIGELVSAAIVVGIMSRFINLVHQGNGSVHGKLIYTEVWGCLSIAFSILLGVPLMYSFFAFPLDLIMFIGWMVAFGLDYNVSPITLFHSRFPPINPPRIMLPGARGWM
jgi:hypothetical protein